LPEDEPAGIGPFAPDLAFEIAPANGCAEKLADKIRSYFAAGVRQFWRVSPEIEGVFLFTIRSKRRRFFSSVTNWLVKICCPASGCL
jgi:Uma2 family endonuclease